VSATPQFRISIKLNDINGTAKSRYPGIAGNARSGLNVIDAYDTAESGLETCKCSHFFALLFFEGTIKPNQSKV
jgi:hypothetical protein